MTGRRAKKGSLIVTILAVISLFTLTKSVETSAATKYIKPEEFIESIVKELNIPVDNDSYVDAAINVGIVKEDDNFSSDLTRADVAVLLNRADEYLYGDTLDQDLVTLALEKRISDINSIDKDKRVDVVKCYLKGFIKGYSNGDYSTDREFRGDKKISRKGALDTIKMLKDKSLRAKISPDGQLIRTTNLPKNADLFPYILASYPNKYYEWELKYQRVKVYENGEEKALENLIDYASPANINKANIQKYDDFTSIKEQHMDEWVKKAKAHMELVFNVNYRTIGDEWYNSILKTSDKYGTKYQKFTERNLQEYMKKVVSNKTIVEYAKLAVDGSTLYYYDGNFYMRIYAKYRILSSKDLSIPDSNTPFSEWSFDKVLYSSGLAHIGDFSLGEWKEGFYDIILKDPEANGNLGVFGIYFINVER